MRKRLKIAKQAEQQANKHAALSDQDAVIDAMRERLKSMRLHSPRRPKKEDGSLLDPSLPADITSINDEHLGRLHGEFAAMCQYAQFQLAMRATEHAIAKRVDRFTRARVRLEKSGTNDDKAAKVEIDSRTRKSGIELLVGEGQERLTQAIFDSYLIGRDLCSREMSRRMGLIK